MTPLFVSQSTSQKNNNVGTDASQPNTKFIISKLLFYFAVNCKLKYSSCFNDLQQNNKSIQLIEFHVTVFFRMLVKI